MELLSTSMVAPSLRVPEASWDLKMMARIEVLPEPDLPIRRTCSRWSVSALQGLVREGEDGTFL